MKKTTKLSSRSRMTNPKSQSLLTNTLVVAFVFPINWQTSFIVSGLGLL